MSEVLHPGPWKGADLVVVDRVVVPALEYGYVKVLVYPGNVPGTQKSDFEGVEETTRSRNAQTHIAFVENAARTIGDQVDARGLNGDKLSYGFPVQVPIRNYAPRVIQIDSGIALGRLYRPGENITGEELGDSLSSRDIDVEGVEGKDWWKKYSGYPKNDSNLTGVTVRAHPGRSGIPESRSPKPLLLSSVQGKGEYRDKVDAHLVPLLDTAGKVLGIGETSVDLAMVEGIDGIIERKVYSAVASRSSKYLVGEHIPARLLDGGKKIWRIRLELWGELIRGLVDNYVDIIFVKSTKTTEKSSV